jgi:electron transfer flavoprotein alpha subunit
MARSGSRVESSLGKLDADVSSDGEAPVFATFQTGAYRPDQATKGGSATVENVEVNIGDVRMVPEPPFQEAKQAVDLTKADVIVAVGRGIKSKDNLALAEKLAEVLGGDLAASRPICDAEWLPIDRQIGSSGQTVAPKLYVALGISGAIPASRRHEKLRNDRSHQQGSRSAHLRYCRLWHRRRPLRSSSRAD